MGNDVGPPPWILDFHLDVWFHHFSRTLIHKISKANRQGCAAPAPLAWCFASWHRKHTSADPQKLLAASLGSSSPACVTHSLVHTGPGLTRHCILMSHRTQVRRIIHIKLPEVALDQGITVNLSVWKQPRCSWSLLASLLTFRLLVS